MTTPEQFNRKTRIWIIGLLLATVGLINWYFKWAREGRYELSNPLPTEPIATFNEIGRKADKGNMLGIQPWMNPTDYASSINLTQKLSGYLNRILLLLHCRLNQKYMT